MNLVCVSQMVKTWMTPFQTWIQTRNVLYPKGGLDSFHLARIIAEAVRNKVVTHLHLIKTGTIEIKM